MDAFSIVTDGVCWGFHEIGGSRDVKMTMMTIRNDLCGGSVTGMCHIDRMPHCGASKRI